MLERAASDTRGLRRDAQPAGVDTLGFGFGAVTPFSLVDPYPAKKQKATMRSPTWPTLSGLNVRPLIAVGWARNTKGVRVTLPAVKSDAKMIGGSSLRHSKSTLVM